ncbi:MAG: cation:proton antiporter [Candidatus Hydrothermarchaeales archaeon]
MADMVVIVSYFSFLLGFGVLVANIMKKVRIPDTFLLLLVGLICGPTIWKNPAVAQYINLTIVDVDAMSVVPDFLRTLALVLIVFTGAFNLNFDELKRFSDVSVNLAFVLVFLNIVILGGAAKLIFGLSWIPALLIGAIISGTDASVVFTFEEPLKKYGNILTVLKVESILNSPLSVLIPLLLLDLLQLSPGTVLAPGVYISQFWQMIVAGIGSGVVIGLGISKIISRMVREYSSLLIISIALLTFGLSEAVGGSGMLGVAVAGFIIGNLGFKHKERVKEFQSEFSDMLRISVFTLLGAQIFLDLNPYLLAVEFLFALLVFVIRPIFVTYISGGMEKELGFEGFTLLKLAAPRGISAAAMAPIAAVALGDALIMDIVFMVIFFSVLLSTLTANLVSSGRAVDIKKKTDWIKARLKGGEENLEETPSATEPEKED